MSQASLGRPQDDPVLQRFRTTLGDIFGDRIERVVLFGSRARGKVRDDSDYDVGVFLKDLTGRRAEVRRLVPVTHEAQLHLVKARQSVVKGGQCQA